MREDTLRDERFEVRMSFDERRGHVASAPELRQPVTALKRIREIEARILTLEVAEERLVMAALDAGLEVHRRIDASPWAILYADEEAVHAEAAE
jgi:hypothetical protein